MPSVLPVPYIAQNIPGSQYGQIQPPPSPPADDSMKCSLPSISNLLGLADAGSPTSESSSHSGSPTPVSRPADSQYVQRPMPPTPPMPTEHTMAPASYAPSYAPMKQVAPVSAVSGPGYYYETTPPLEDQRVMPRLQTQHQPVSQFSSPQTYAPQYNMPPYYAQQQIPGMYYQRPLPQFPPMMATPGANVWQHHHYIAPNNTTPSYPQSQDRYICQTCNKAFSRPSSLRIHSHSHTGEKPFKCPVDGCGKAFSVRSNMKRHERGCHNYEYNSSSGSMRSRNSSPHA